METKSISCIPCFTCFGVTEEDGKSTVSRDADGMPKVGIKYQMLGEFPISTTVTPVQPAAMQEKKSPQMTRISNPQSQQQSIKLLSTTQENAFLGELHFNLCYRYHQKQLIISINSLKYPPRLGEDVVGVSIRLIILPESINIVQTKALPAIGIGSDPLGMTWDETFVFSEFPSKDLYWHKIQLSLLANYLRPVESSQILGTTEVKLTPLLTSDNVPDIVFHCRRYLQPPIDEKRGSGRILISSEFIRSPPSLRVTFLQCRSLDMPKMKTPITNLRANVRFTDNKGSLIREEFTNLSRSESQHFSANTTVTFVGYKEEEFLNGLLKVSLFVETGDSVTKMSSIKVGAFRIGMDSILSGYLEEVMKAEGRPVIQWHCVKLSRDTT